jgi:alpha-amylase
VTRKGSVVGVFSNVGEDGADYWLYVAANDHGFGNSASVMEVTQCKLYVTRVDGWLDIEMSQGLPKIFYPANKLTGTGLCEDTLSAKRQKTPLSRHARAHAQ